METCLCNRPGTPSNLSVNCGRIPAATPAICSRTEHEYRQVLTVQDLRCRHSFLRCHEHCRQRMLAHSPPRQDSWCGCESVHSVQSYVTKTRQTLDRNRQKCMILLRPGSILTKPVSMMSEDKDSAKDVQSSLGACTCRQHCSKSES